MSICIFFYFRDITTLKKQGEEELLAIMADMKDGNDLQGVKILCTDINQFCNSGGSF